MLTQQLWVQKKVGQDITQLSLLYVEELAPPEGRCVDGFDFLAWATDALRRNVTTFVKQLSGTYSIFTSLPWIFDIKFPNLYERVLERLSIVNVDMSFSLECILERRVTYQDRLLAATIGPVAVILVVIVSVEIIL